MFFHAPITRKTIPPPECRSASTSLATNCSPDWCASSQKTCPAHCATNTPNTPNPAVAMRAISPHTEFLRRSPTNGREDFQSSVKAYITLIVGLDFKKSDYNCRKPSLPTCVTVYLQSLDF